MSPTIGRPCDEPYSEYGEEQTKLLTKLCAKRVSSKIEDLAVSKYDISMTLSQPDFLEYREIDLESLPKLSDISYQPVELRGVLPLDVALPFFAKLRDIVPEITYRSDPGEKAVLIFSSLNDDGLIRPIDVEESPVRWKESELKKFGSGAAVIKNESETRVDLGEMWNIKASDSREKKFYKKLYAISPHVERAVLFGECPLLPALVALNWFMPFAKSVYYGQQLLK